MVSDTRLIDNTSECITLQPVSEVMQPHVWELSVLLPQDVLHSAEALVQLIELRLDLCVVSFLGHHVHDIEGKVAELGTNEVVFARLSWHNVSQL